MKSHTPSRRRTHRLRLPADTAQEAERLTALATVVEAALAADEDHLPTIVVAVDDGDAIEVRLRPLDHHPTVELEGLVAPPSWWCLGIVTGGDARSYAAWPDPGGASTDGPFRVHVAQLLTRSGLSARVLRDRRTDAVLVADAGAVPADPTDAARGDGLLDDYLRCAMGVPTPPPHRGTVELFASLWIHHVMNEAALHRLLHAPWSTVAELHPVLDTTRSSSDPQLHDWALEHLVRAGELLAEAHPWERVRSSCQLGIGPISGAPAELAGWLDDGAFSRLVMAGFGPIEDLLVDLHELVRPDVYAQLVDTIDGWGLLAGS